MRVVLATSNPGKQREFSALLQSAGIELVLQSELGIVSGDETGTTFEANALLKARHAALHSGLPALADDSGIEVDALGGRPGVYSARYAGPEANDAANNRLLLRELSEVSEPHRAARYRCVLAMVRDDRDPEPLLVEGVWEGHIARQPAGTGGFGYDPLFIPAGEQRTAGQISAEDKNRVSHRGKALATLLEALSAWR